jgi:hypothetical protein
MALPIVLPSNPALDPPDQVRSCADPVTLSNSLPAPPVCRSRLKLQPGQALHALVGRVNILLYQVLPRPSLLGNQSALESLAMQTMDLVPPKRGDPVCILKEHLLARPELRWMLTRHGWKIQQETFPLRGPPRLSQYSRHHVRIKQTWVSVIPLPRSRTGTQPLPHDRLV